MKDPFDILIKHIFDIERGYVDHPDDAGGPTNWGITTATLSAWRGYPVTKIDVMNLDSTEATEIYRHRYWNLMSLVLLDHLSTALCLFDQGVNRGTQAAVQMAQKTANKIAPEAALRVDGMLGPLTAVALNRIDPELFCERYVREAQIAYVRIARGRPSQLAFLEGWIKRTHRLQDVARFGL